MKNLLILLLVALTGCYRTNTIQDDVQKLREEVSRKGEIEEREILNWFNILDSIDYVAQANPNKAIKGIDSLLDKIETTDRDRISELLFLKGDIYYEMDSLGKAIEAYSYSNRGPKSRVARAAALIKLKDFQGAYSDLKEAAEINYDYRWNLGNYFEIKHQKDSAIINYQALFQKDTIVYARCKERIKELGRPNPQYLTELIFFDRKRIAAVLK